ncbi:molybdopterin dinucleotide-binding region [Streptomyces albus]|uniref:Molybdopterin dinucleotide-binding region n=1 Tax=Streptomyces albus (strain ATCC 21838 / DSM 41398 / FERM P-419 / JCM 4703 / NBRC 107858) TaxID=1081613 RepID=A0A0B5F1B0_STRA4|nr:molybdopterin dinucleotide-binding region [Streptomyces albus]AOU79632.1 molybdopterin dinucleotide-binding region [Streptomyces albus]
MVTGTTRHHRICPLCEAGCGLTVDLEGRRVVKVRGARDDVFSKGYACPKGISLGEIDQDPERCHAPLVRQPDGRFAEVTWDEAFAEVARGLGRVAEQHGKDAVALYYGNPVIHTVGIPLHVAAMRQSMQSRNVYSSSTVDQMPKNVSAGLMFGDPWAIPVPDIDRTDHLLILGANPLVSNGSLWTVPDLPGRIRALKARGGRLVVVDPRRTRTAEVADQHVTIRPGTDALLLFALVHTLFDEGLTAPLDPARYAGEEQLRQAAEEFSPEAVAEVCGTTPGTVRGLARELAAAPSAAVYARMGTTAVAFGTVASWLVDVVNALTGNLDRPGGAMFGEAQHNALRPTGPLALGRWHSRVRGLPEVLGELPAATLADEIDTPGEGQVRALVAIACNPVLGAPNGERLERSLADLDFMVAVDPYVNETTRHAHVILPPPRVLESEHFDIVLSRLAVRRVARYSPPLLPREEGRPSEAEILAKLTLILSGAGPEADPASLDSLIIDKILGAVVAAPGSPLAGRDPAELKAQLTGEDSTERRIDLMLRLGAFGDAFGLRPDGVNLAVLRERPEGMDFGPLRPQLDEIVGAESRVALFPEPVAGDLPRLAEFLAAERERGAGSFLLVGRRHLRSTNSWTHNIAALSGGTNHCALEINAEDARRLGIGPGDEVTVRGRAGAVVALAEPTDRVGPGVVSLPHGWGHGRDGTRMAHAAKAPGVNVNALTDELVVDPLSGNAVFNAVPVEVSPGRGDLHQC